MTQNNATNNPGKPELDESIPVIGIHKSKNPEVNGYTIYIFDEPGIIDRLRNPDKVRYLDTMEV
jgi:hypothetical protein